MKSLKGQNIFQDVIHSVYDIKNVVSFSRKRIRGYFSFICILALIITMFTTIIPVFRVVSQLDGVNSIITTVVPDFEYSKKELKTEYFKCEIDDNAGTLFMIDTSRTLEDIILNDYNKALIVDKSHFAYKTETGEITSKYFSDYLGDTEISRESIIAKSYWVYVFLVIMTIFSWLFVSISLLFVSFVLAIFLLLLNRTVLKIKNIKFVQFLNISVYCLGLSSIIKGILSCFNYTLYLSIFDWYTLIQIPAIIVAIVFSFKQFKLNNNLVDKFENDLADYDSDTIDEELGFSAEDKEYRDAMKKTVTDLQKSLKEEISRNTKEDNQKN